MAPFQNKMRLSTGAKGNVVNKKALVSMKGALKEHAKKNKVLEAALAEEQVKTAAMGKKARAFEIITRKGVSLAKTAYGERETARLIYGKARPYIAPKKVVMDADVAEAMHLYSNSKMWTSRSARRSTRRRERMPGTTSAQCPRPQPASTARARSRAIGNQRVRKQKERSRRLAWKLKRSRWMQCGGWHTRIGRAD